MGVKTGVCGKKKMEGRKETKKKGIKKRNEKKRREHREKQWWEWALIDDAITITSPSRIDP